MPSSKPLAHISAALLALGVAATPAQAIVVQGMVSMARPANAAVGSWYGSSGVPVGPQWFITARHVGGTPNSWFQCNGTWHLALEIRQHPTLDLQMVRVAETFDTWHRIAEGGVSGDPCIMGGWGVTAAAELPNNAGYTWGGPHQEMWGANVLQNATSVISVRFDAPGTNNAVPYEASFAVNDSGGGLFTWGADGQLELCAIAVSISGFGQAAYGQSGYAVRLEPVKAWIMEVADPTMPITSSVVAPRSSLVGPGWLGIAAGTAMLAGLAGVRSRRHRRIA